MQATPFTDSRGRRKRYAGRIPTGKFMRAYPSYIKGFFEPLQRHGALASNYLYEFRKLLTGKKNWNQCQVALKELYNEETTKHRGPYLDRPPQQRNCEGADWQFLTYTLMPAAYRALESVGKRYRYAQQADKGWFDHQQMTGAITASIELACRRHGFVYGDQEEILSHEYCPDTTKAMPVPIALQLGTSQVYTRSGRLTERVNTVIPDQLFKIEYPKPTIRFFVLEADRATEDYETIREKMRKWIYVLENDIHRKQWGTPSLIVLWATTNTFRKERMMEILKSLTKDTSQHLFKAFPVFDGANGAPPILYDALEVPWDRADGSKFSLMY